MLLYLVVLKKYFSSLHHFYLGMYTIPEQDFTSHFEEGATYVSQMIEKLIMKKE